LNVTKLYFAYGSNLNVSQMARRCPAAVKVGKFMLADAKLVFRGVADVVGEPGAGCHGGIWLITAACEEALDRYESYNPVDPEAGMYCKTVLPITGYGEHTELMLYQMNSTGIMPPSVYYLNSIKQGYKDFGLALAPLKAAIKESWDDKSPGRHERARRLRDGNQLRALSSTVDKPIWSTGQLGPTKSLTRNPAYEPVWPGKPSTCDPVAKTAAELNRLLATRSKVVGRKPDPNKPRKPNKGRI